jgi:probable F420-dependent oxidoreductase
MKYGLHLAGGALVCGRKELKEVAAAAEDLGFDSILIGDHIINAKQIDSPWPYTEYYGSTDPKQLPFSIYTDVPWLDPFDTLAFLAAATEKPRLGLSVLIVPYRNPYDVARRIATLDVLSGGRIILGAGVGWMEEEFRLLGIPFKERAQRTREYIAVMKAVWTQENPRFDGQFIKLDRDVNMLPRPLQQPHPPIWVGGESMPALRRVVEFGDGWHIALLTLEQISSLYERLRVAMDNAKRDFSKLEFTAMVDMARLSPGVVESYRKFNVSTLYMLPMGGSLGEFIQGMERFATMMRTAG